MNSKTHLTTSLAALFVAARVFAAGDATALSQQGWQLLQSGKPAEAVAKFKEAVKLAPKDATAKKMLEAAKAKQLSEGLRQTIEP